MGIFKKNRRPEDTGEGPRSLPADSVKRDTALALRNATTLGLSLIATWSVALVVRLYLPRKLGPELFGAYNYAENFAIGSTAILSMGIDTYIQKEVAVRPSHASEFFGTLNALRALLTPFLLAVCYLILRAMGRSPFDQEVALLYSAAQILVITNSNQASLIQASCKVSGLAILNVASKLIWGAAVAVILLGGRGILAITAVFFISEVLRGLALYFLARKHVGLTLTFQWKALPPVLLGGLPFGLANLGSSVYGSIGRLLLARIVDDTEVGYYGAAFNFASLALFLSPLVGAALLPVLSKTAARSDQDMQDILSQAIELVLMLALPVSLIMGVGADIWSVFLFGKAYAPSAPSLRVLSGLFVLTYLSMLMVAGLLQRGRSWDVAAASLLGIVINPIMAYALIGPFRSWIGPGGAAFGVAVALLLTEAVIITMYSVRLGQFPLARDGRIRMAKAIVCVAAVIAVDLLIKPLGPARLAVDFAVYAALVLLFRAVRPRVVIQVARMMLFKNITQHEPSPAPPAAGPASPRASQ